ncbi:hypothetical protein A5N15_07885 [Rothia kristinae]|uniref:Uncharacterized protein n=1 Tax=Rothia kristinae TaxID=37923 RepID=A0A657IU89_9MICC|nr:hypothetical protein A5N15_07885 [Rothia kristinae]
MRRRARPIWLVSAAALVIMAAFALQFRASGVPQSELILGHSDARDGQQIQAEHFPGGSGTPAQVIVAADAEQRAGQILRETDGVDSVSVVAADSPTGTVPLDQQQRSAPPYDGAQPSVADGDVMLEVTLSDAPDSAARRTRCSGCGTGSPPRMRTPWWAGPPPRTWTPWRRPARTGR